MGVIRNKVTVDTSYTSVPNDFARDKRLSRRARGLLVEIMSHRVGWRISVRSLTAGGPEGRDAIATALRELREAGYLVSGQDQDVRGRFEGVEYELRNPHNPDSDDKVSTTASGFTASGFSVSGESAPKKKRSQEDQSSRTPGNSSRAAGALSHRQIQNVTDAVEAIDERTSLDVVGVLQDELQHLDGLDAATRSDRIQVWSGLRSRARTHDMDDLGEDERLRHLLVAHGYTEEDVFAEMEARS